MEKAPAFGEGLHLWSGCKPGFVPSCEGDDHLSGRIVTDRLKQPTRIPTAASRFRFTCVNGILLGLAPDEVYRATPVTRCAVSSYLAISPLLALRRAVYFLLHFLSCYHAWMLSSILPCGARTFLQLAPAAIRHSTPKYRKTPFEMEGRIIKIKKLFLLGKTETDSAFALHTKHIHAAFKIHQVHRFTGRHHAALHDTATQVCNGKA